MLIITNPVRLYGRKVVTDLALRSGSPDAKSFSTQTGLSPWVDRLWSESTFASRESLFEKQTDFDADVVQPHFKEYDEAEEEVYGKDTPYNPAIDKLDFDKYFRKLEDIADDYLENYVGNLVYTICRLNGGVKAFNYMHAVAPTLIDHDDGSATELADLELDYDKNEWSDSEVKKAMTQLPYVLRRFLNLSCYTGIHVLSFVCSYLVATTKNKLAHQAGSTKILKKNAVISENVWTCDSSGKALKKIDVSNKNLKAYELFDWMEGTLNKYVTYKVDVTNFMHYVKVLNLDISEDMSIYGPEFVRSLTVTNLTPNAQYNQRVHDALSNGTVVGDAVDTALQKTISRFSELCASNENMKKVIDTLGYTQRLNNFTVARNLHNAYLMTQGIIGEKMNYEFYNGFLYCNGEMVVIGSGLITDATFDDGRIIISELGFCLAVSESLVLNLMSVYIAQDNMKLKLSRNVEEKPEGWWFVSL